ncbi:hypothetical protein G6F42_028979 [Rhizopus arrhizus]|nr:hypothetical protein G6F42_028979 [Rhizopus arrhizus]
MHSACTFNRPVSVYFAGDAITLLPVLLQEKMKVSVAPLTMRIATTREGDKPNHWATMKLGPPIDNCTIKQCCQGRHSRVHQ